MRYRTLGMCGAIVGVAVLGACGPVKKAPPAPHDTLTFHCTLATQTWTVPVGVAQATLDIYGARGATWG